MTDMIAVSLMHHGTQAEHYEGEPQTRTAFLKELSSRWNEPVGRHL